MRSIQHTFLVPNDFSSIIMGFRTGLRLFLLVSSLLDPCTATFEPLKVKTAIGTVYGTIDSTTPHVAQFLGIPYAEPPISSLRFAAPTAKTPVAGSINATKIGPSCPQFEGAAPTLYNVDGSGFLITGPKSEDCLTVNIWAPVKAEDRKLPVIVWLHEGNYQTGGGNSAYQIPTQWVERSQAHIVVGIK